MNRLQISILLIFIPLLFFVLLVGGTIPYFLFYVFLLTFLIPLLHSLISLMGIKGSVQLPKDALFTGEKISIAYEVKNNSIFRIPYMEIQSHILEQLTGIDYPNVALALEKKEDFIRKEIGVLKRRGYYQLGEIHITIRDVFGFFSFKKKIRSNASLLVYPEVVSLSTFKINVSQQSGELLIQDSFFQDKSRIDSLREYREGDSIKAIHWKLTAKKDMPIIKNFENRGDTHVVVFVDNEHRLFKYDIDRHLEDKAAVAAISIVNYCLNQNIEVNLITQDNKSHINIQGRQSAELKPFLEALARFKGNGALDFRFLIMPSIDALKRGSTVVIITPNLDKAMGVHGIQLKMKNYNPLFIVITDRENKTGYIDQLVEKRLKQEGIIIYILDHSANIKEALEVFHG